MSNANIKGFITNLGKYNEGDLVGEWITFPIDDEELKEVFQRIEIDGVNYEEYFFTDWESDFELDLGEYESVDHVNELAEMFDALDDWDLEVVEAILECDTNDIMEAIENVNNYIFYAGATLSDVAYELVEECYFTKETPEIFKTYFDYDAFARDLSFEGYKETSGGVLVRC